MGVLQVVIMLVVVCAVFGAVHTYLWRRLVRDVSVRGARWRRVGTVVVVLLPVTTFAALFLSRADGVPFWIKQALAWPGNLWLACLLYLTPAVALGEAVRPLLRRLLERRAARAGVAAPGRDDVTEAVPRDAALVASGSAAPAPPPAADGPSRPAGADAPDSSDAPDALDAPDDGAPPPDPSRPTPALSRRLFVARTVGAGAAVAGLGTVAAGTWSVLNGPTVKAVTVPLAKLPRRAGGYRIAVVSDIHLGPVLGRAHTQRVVDAINGTQPDAVAIVGDLVDGTVAELGGAAEPLAQLRSRHGAYFVTGNHEYFGDADDWIERVRELGVTPLENARRELPAFDLAGVNDISGEDQGEGPDYTAALGDRDPGRASVLLAHQPVMIHDAVREGVDLQLSGHSHGGQLWPGEYLAALANPTVAGLERYGDTQLYVTRGAGAWGPPTRVGADSDITVVTLASRQA